MITKWGDGKRDCDLGLRKVAVFFDERGDFPGAEEALGKGNKIALAEGDGILLASDLSLTSENVTLLSLVTVTVKF